MRTISWIRQNMYTWIKNRNIEKKKKESVDYSDTPEQRRHHSLELKLSLIRLCFEDVEDIKSVSRNSGYSRTSIYLWRRKYIVGGVAALASIKSIYLEVKLLQIRLIIILGKKNLCQKSGNWKWKMIFLRK